MAHSAHHFPTRSTPFQTSPKRLHSMNHESYLSLMANLKRYRLVVSAVDLWTVPSRDQLQLFVGAPLHC